MGSGTIDPLALAGAKAKGKRPAFLENADTERLLNITLVLIQEVAVMRERIDTLERLLEQKDVLARTDIEAFSPTKAEAAQRGLWMQEYLARVFRVIQQEREGMSADDQYSEEVAEELAKG
ncbi:MAG: hypothetical protein ACOYKM_04140 [Caulobacterales bacterium]|jgi:hypothetical protein